MLLAYTTPIFLAGIRMFIAGSILLTYQYFYEHQQFRFKWKDLKYFLQIILLGIYASYILRFWAMQTLSAPKASFFFNLSPLFTALYSYLMFKEKLSRKQWVGLAIGFLGMIPILLSTSSGEANLGEFARISWPELAIFGAVATAAWSWIVVRKLIRDKSYAPAMVNGLCMFVGGGLALITAFFVESCTPVGNFLPFVGLLATIILISNIFCHNLYGYLLKHYSATFLSFCGFLTPLFTAFYSWVFLSEKVTWHFYASAGIVFIGLFIFYKDELKGFSYYS